MLDLLNFSGPFRQPAGCVIESAPGQAMTWLYPMITEVKVETSRKEAATATITCEARVDENGEWLIQDNKSMAVNETIIISSRFSAFETAPVFEGYILRISPSYPNDRGAAKVVIECRDNTILLDRNFRKETWPADTLMDDVTFVRQMAMENGLTPDPDNENGPTTFTYTQNDTDIAFMNQRACQNGFEFYVRGKSVYYGPMRLSADPQPTIKIYAGKRTNCVNFEVSQDAHHADTLSLETAPQTGNTHELRTVRSDLDLMGRDPAKNPGAPLGENHWFMRQSRTPNTDDAEHMAQTLINEDAMSITATGELDGSLYGHVLQFGLPVGVNGAGDRNDGRYYVDSVDHIFSASGYKQKFTLLRNALGNDLPSVGSKLAGVI